MSQPDTPVTERVARRGPLNSESAIKRALDEADADERDAEHQAKRAREEKTPAFAAAAVSKRSAGSRLRTRVVVARERLRCAVPHVMSLPVMSSRVGGCVRGRNPFVRG